jgi:hypothetical protein
MESHKKNLISIYKIHKNRLNLQTKFIAYLNTFKDPVLEKSFYETFYYINKYNKPITDKDQKENYFIKFLEKNKIIQIKFMQLLRTFVTLLNKMNIYTEVKTIKKVDISQLKILLRKRTRDYAYFREVMNLYTSIYKRVRYFISNMFMSSNFFFTVSTIKYKYYYNSKNNSKKQKCQVNNCNDSTDKELEEKFNEFIEQKKLLMKESENKNNKIKMKSVETFINSDAFKNYYKCFYDSCNRTFLSYLRSKVKYYYAIESLRSPIYDYRYKKEFEKVIKVFRYSNVKSYEDFLNAIAEYWKFVVKLNIYI